MLKRLIWAALSLGWLPAQAQSSGAIAYYPFNNLLSISTNPDKSFWVDFRFQTNSLTTSLTNEIAPMVAIKRQPSALYYVGGGVNWYPLRAIEGDSFNTLINGYFLSAGVRAFPLEKNRRLGVNFELSPLVFKNFDLGTFRALLGVSYRLKP
jgi:hypothetical protein